MITIPQLKDFWKLPVSRQLASAAFIVIGALLGYMAVDAKIDRSDKARLQKQVDNCAARESELRRQHGTEMLELQQRQSDRDVKEIEELKAEMRAMIAEKNAVVDEALKNARTVINAQNRAQKNIKRALSEASK